jgi:hypothetical protein
MKTENKITKRENAELKKKITELEAKIVALGGKKNRCRNCGQPKGEFLYIGQSKEFPTCDVQVRFFRCENCGCEYEKQYLPSY